MNNGLIVLLLIGAAFVLFYLNSKSTGTSILDPQAAKEKLREESGVVIDVRTREEYNTEHLQLADHNYDLLSGEFERELEKLDKSRTYYLYCRSGNRSGKAQEKMLDRGFENVYNIGGIGELKKGGFKTE